MPKLEYVKEASLLLLENNAGEFLIQNRKTISKAGELWVFLRRG